MSWSYKFTLEEYTKECEDYHAGRLQQPSKTDHTDPLYLKKYAHTMPPLAAYKFRHPDSHNVSTKQNIASRTFFYGWNNLSDFETEQIAAIKAHMHSILVEIPKNFDDRELLKFVQANHFDLQKTGVKLTNTFKWLTQVADVQVTP